MKREYMKPTMRVVKLQHKCQILTGSGGLRGVNSSGIDSKDDFEIDDTPAGEGFWGK